MTITNSEAIEHIKKLAEYCLEHNRCEGCIFKPKDYKPVTNECLFGFTPCDVDSKIREKIRNGEENKC